MYVFVFSCFILIVRGAHVIIPVFSLVFMSVFVVLLLFSYFALFLA